MANIVADQFVETLVAAGVKRIYGIVGDSLNGLCAPMGGLNPTMTNEDRKRLFFCEIERVASLWLCKLRADSRNLPRLQQAS
jgi:hypothetical protein